MLHGGPFWPVFTHSSPSGFFCLHTRAYACTSTAYTHKEYECSFLEPVSVSEHPQYAELIPTTATATLPQPTTSLLMWWPFHCRMPCCLPQRRIHPAMMNVLGSHSKPQLVHSLRASASPPARLSWRHHYAFASITQFKLKAAREMLGSGRREEVRRRRLPTGGGAVVGERKLKRCV